MVIATGKRTMISALNISIKASKLPTECMLDAYVVLHTVRSHAQGNIPSSQSDCQPILKGPFGNGTELP